MTRNKKIKFKIYTLGCKVNQYDSATLTSLLINLGLFLSDKNPDLIIVNSCSVTKSAILKAKKIINSLKRKNPKSKIILIGCWPRIYNINNLDVDLISNSKEYKDIINDIENAWPNFFSENIKEDVITSYFNPIEDRSRYFIKVQDGCQQFCSYCIIPFSRGPLISCPIKEIIEEIERAIANGFSEIVLSGIHLGLYGQDFSTKEINLYKLILKILRIKGLGRIRLSSIEVTEVSDEIIDLISKNKKMCRHLHIPLQSGNDKILRLMNRPYDKKYFLNKIKRIRKKIPDISITTDVIVGFPGETKKDFRETFDFCREIYFSKIHVFSFSAHEKAPVFHFPDKVDLGEIKNRSAKLRLLSQKMEKEYQQEILCKSDNFMVLIENISDKFVKLKTEFYFDIVVGRSDFKNDCPLISLNSQDNCIGKIIEYKPK
ncbi:MAG TPA: tRNA (N(6)-L-threonylcarbamoyladenosine(37)-C(2))-methylthiotransferase MtaB [bacterium]|nr:tRNA (N(6)-L-threonylcarbamoyladenosine(37)-C(2))-methylthiotransferase MtaB [bacterium]